MIYENIQRLCEEKGISIWKLEKTVEISNGSIIKWKDSSPSLKTVKKIADYFGVAIEELLK